MTATVAGIHLGLDTHANRPAANTVPDGALYSCSDHGLVYKSNYAGNSWATWRASTAVTEIIDIPTAETDDTLVLAPDGVGGVEFRAEAGGGGSSTIQYPKLKPATPTYDFDSALSGFTARTITLSDVVTQAIDGSAVRLPFVNQIGGIYVSQANTDFDIIVGGLELHSKQTGMMPGIAALNSSGTGVGIVQYNDSNAYLAGISSYSYTGFSHTFSNFGWPEIWMRLKRVSGVWTGYVSLSGTTWDATSATRSDSITVDRVMIGTFLNAGYGWVHADFLDIV